MLSPLKTHINFMWDFKNGLEATFMEVGGEYIAGYHPVQRNIWCGGEKYMSVE